MTNMHPVSFDPVSVLLRVDQINPVTLAEFPGTRTFVERLVYDMSATSMSLLVMPEATARFLAPARHVSAHSPEPDISRSDDTVYSAVLAELTGVTAPILDHSEEPISVSANFGNIVLALGLYLVHRLTDRRARGASDTADLLAKDKAL